MCLHDQGNKLCSLRLAYEILFKLFALSILNSVSLWSLFPQFFFKETCKPAYFGKDRLYAVHVSCNGMLDKHCGHVDQCLLFFALYTILFIALLTNLGHDPHL